MRNGCGCQTGILKWFKPPYSKLFYTACCCHDDDYDRGGTEKDRKRADRTLFYRMIKTVYSRFDSPFRIIFMCCIPLLYYVSVRLFGGRYFNKGI